MHASPRFLQVWHLTEPPCIVKPGKLILTQYNNQSIDLTPNSSISACTHFACKTSVHFKPENFSGAICRACGKKKSSEFKQKLPSFSNTLDSFLLCPGSRGDLTPKSGRDRRQTNREQSIPTSIWMICQSGDEPAVEHCQWHSAIFIS